MTFEEFYDMAGVVVRLHKDLEAAERLATDRQRERDQARDELGPVALQLSAHVESLRLSNAQCGEYLRQNEQLRADVATVAEELKRDISSLVHAATAERDKLHSELVNVRAALASVTEQRDSLRRTLDEWERADTKPHARIDEVAQVVLQRTLDEWERADTKPHARLDPMSVDFSPEPAPAFMMRVQFSATPPVKVDDVADHVVPPVLPICTTCHHCGNTLDASVFGPYNVCTTVGCPRTVTNNDDGLDKNPYDGPCHAGILVRHE